MEKGEKHDRGNTGSTLPLYRGKGLGQVLHTHLVSHDDGDKQIMGKIRKIMGKIRKIMGEQ